MAYAPSYPTMCCCCCRLALYVPAPPSLQGPAPNGTAPVDMRELTHVSALVLAITQRVAGFIGTLHSACELLLVACSLLSC
jgi:hypothetical protein